VVGSSVTEADYTKIGPAVGELFPDFELPDAEGHQVWLHQWRRGRRALVVFFRSAAW
jgi:peroxiredoxin